jgi:penicillin-binding protein 2
MGESGSGEYVASDEPPTQELPPELRPSALPPPAPLPSPAGRKRNPAVVALSLLLVAAVIAGGLTFALRSRPSTPSTSTRPGCETGTPCQVADDYLLAYTGGKYEAMYALTSNASHQRFSDPAILRGAYKDAHDYIVNRTQSILAEARIDSMSATPGSVTQSSGTTASMPVRVVMNSARVGSFTQDITITLVQEKGQWRVNWSPGLIFAQLDDPTYDPTYARVVRMFPQNALRGTIYDRDGNVLAKDETVYQIDVVPGQITDEKTLLNVLSKNLDMTTAEIQAKYQGAKPTDSVLIRTITPMLYQQVGQALNAVAGVSAQQATGRVYPYGSVTAAVTGYISQISSSCQADNSTDYYEDGDIVGCAGVEQWGEQYLRPLKGGKLAIAALNADGFSYSPVYSIAERAAVNGADVHTTISLSNQHATMAAMKTQVDSGKGKGSGAVAVNPATGEVQVLASYPIYDPNDFSLGFTQNELARLNAMDHPYLNRAIAAPEPIGSVFKLVTMATGLENGVTTSQLFTCNGKYQVPGESIIRNDDNPNGHGTLTVEGALPPSCDVIFWQVAILVNSKNPNAIPAMAKAMGFGSATGMIGLPTGAEDPGFVPDPQWVQSQGKQWNASYAADLGVGQGYFLATPAQVAVMTAALGNNGIRMQPRLVNTVVNANGSPLITFPAKQVSTLPMSADTLSAIQGAMVAAINDPAGTSYYVFKNFPILVGGKTGSAESGNGNLPHAWFTAYAPASPLSGPPVTPTIAVCIETQYAGFGATNAAPIGRTLLAAYFNVH